MIIGNGMLAKLFSSYNANNGIIIFASGVANSKEISQIEFDREFILLKNTINDYPDKILVYFSTSSMYDPESCNSPYVRHKLNMEDYVVNHIAKYYIFRISQIIGRANNTTLVNFIIDNVLDGREFSLWKNATRNLIAIDDVKKIICYIIDNNLMINNVINVANKYNISMLELVMIVEEVLCKSAKYYLVEIGEQFMQIETSSIMELCKLLNINFDNKFYYHNAIRMII